MDERETVKMMREKIGMDGAGSGTAGGGGELALH